MIICIHYVPLVVASCCYSCLVVLIFDHRHQPSTSQNVFIIQCPAAAVIVTVHGGLPLIPLSSVSGGGEDPTPPPPNGPLPCHCCALSALLIAHRLRYYAFTMNATPNTRPPSNALVVAA
jgi:hypothetical protein